MTQLLLAGIPEYWRDPQTGKTFDRLPSSPANPNEMMATIHDRMPGPGLLRPEDYARWISSAEDRHDLMQPFPAELMTQWKIGRNVGSPNNDSPDIIEEIDPQEPVLL